MKKDFDCVEMKRHAQRELRQEYESRRSEFASYEDFINQTLMEHPLSARFVTREAGDVRGAAAKLAR